MTSYVLDTSALLTVLNQEDGLDTVLSLLDMATEGQATVYVPFMVLMELEYLLLRKIGPEEHKAINRRTATLPSMKN